MGLLTNLLKKYGYVKNEACSTQSGPSAHLSAGVQGLDFVLGLSYRTPIMVWIIKKGVFTLPSREYIYCTRRVNSL